MTDPSKLHRFLENIMRINVTNMGGAAAGIIGSSDAGNDILNDLKKSSVAVAQEYQKKERNQDELATMADQITGYLQTLQLTHTLSERTTEELINQLDELMDEVPA